MNVDRTTRTFTDFLRERGHILIPGHSLVPPPGDPVLFTTSGMHPLTPYLEGLPHPQGRRLVDVQRCLRTTDLEEVGDDTHLTVFEMLGSWSLGDYPGVQSLLWGYELLRDGFGISPDRLHVTVFGGDDQLGPDETSLRTWEDVGVPVELTRDENWWSNGPTGPCGPDSEIFVWTGETPPQGTPTTDSRWTEVWNHVMMRYRRHDDGTLEPLVPERVDTGMGLERLLTILQGKKSVFDCDIFQPWTRNIPSLWELDDRSLRIVCDHLRSTVVVVGDDIHPSNTQRGYVLRRLIRRVLTTLWRTDPTRTLVDLPTEPLDHTIDHFKQDIDVSSVRDILRTEEDRFRSLMRRGRTIVSRHRSRGNSTLTDDDYRYLHDTHGLPRDLVNLLDEPAPEQRVG
jgi:alanyl-tRNA synthetase